MLLSLLLYLSVSSRVAIGQQISFKLPSPPNEEARQPVKVAIIGAGIAGASAAYQLHDQYANTNIETTLYEAQPKVGGKIKSAQVYNGAHRQQVDTGAKYFYSDDDCIQSLIDETGLRRKLESHYPVESSTGVWNGAEFVLYAQGDLKARSWMDWARYAWRYGVSVNKIRTWLLHQLPRYRRLLGRWEYIDRHVPEEVHNKGLTPELESNAANLLSNFTSQDFIHEVVQATTRAWLGQDPGTMRGLGALAAMNPAATESFTNGGTRTLVERLIKLSDATLHLNTHVKKIQKSPTTANKYRLTIISTPPPNHDDNTRRPSTAHHADYDAIILATPLHRAHLEFDMDRYIPQTTNPPTSQPRHITHFTSASPLSKVYFNLSASAPPLPSHIYTTTAPSTPHTPPPFFSIEHSLASLGLDGCILQTENLYRVLTASPLTDSTILAFLGHEPGSKTLQEAGVRWVHREQWEGAVVEYDGQPVLDDIEIAEGIFYTGVGEQLVSSSLEMSCRMGVRAAELLYYGKVAGGGGEMVP
ncbi:MAG: hypothetical protein Q9219_004681 [cf. Caloplaca sp. 3 TL-2023]